MLAMADEDAPQTAPAEPAVPSEQASSSAGGDPADLISQRIRTRDLIGALDRAFVSLDFLRTTFQLIQVLDLACTGTHSRAPGRAHTLARDRAADRDRALAAREVVASGADLSGLPVPDLEVLVGVVWDRDTRWAPGVRERVAACSEEISPGVYRVVPGGNERDPHEVLSL